CGNSLIGPDYFTGRLIPNAEEFARVNAFDWQREFPDAMKAGSPRAQSSGGFDCIIGNPPYLKIEHIDPKDREWFAESYETFSRRYDTFGLFVEKSLSLLATSGLSGMIIPSTFLNNMSFAVLRKKLLRSSEIRRIVNLGGHVFEGVNNDTLILLFAKGVSRGSKTEIYHVEKYGAHLNSARCLGSRDLAACAEGPYFPFELKVSEEGLGVLTKLNASGLKIGNAYECFQGFVTGGNEAYIIDNAAAKAEGIERGVCKPAVFGDEISRYGVPAPKQLVIYLTRESDLNAFPNAKRRLLPFKPLLERKREVLNGRQPWFSLHWPRVASNFERVPKILVQTIRNLSLKRRVVATLDDKALYADHTLNVLYPKDARYDLAFVLGVLNSRLINWVFSNKFIDINIKGVYLLDVPLPQLDFKKTESKVDHDRMVSLVDSMLAMHKQLASANGEAQRGAIQRQIEATDREIDWLVYDLYGLTKEEIAIVEGQQ
ncbi:MAG: Eco57I restriction-modification methylase domain-containing protein, partial [candidate division Zixibacteria bacterium]|nr:Eco57I restriction-modification methylase domain-containing protein [candidate division Zixibacteria bacterium]